MQNTLYLLRHARVPGADGLCYGRSEIVADADATQAAACAAAAALPRPARIQVSPRQRCQQLAQALAALRPDWPPALNDARLQEMDFGDYEMQAWHSIPALALKAWTDDFAQHPFGGGESTMRVLARVAAALEAAKTLARQHGGPQLWITHAGIIRAVHYLLQHGAVAPTSAAQWPQIAHDFGTWSVMTL